MGPKYIEIVQALHEFKAPDPSCIDLKKGDIIHVFSKDSSGWWNGSVNDIVGWFPSNYVANLPVFLYLIVGCFCNCQRNCGI